MTDVPWVNFYLLAKFFRRQGRIQKFAKGGAYNKK